MKWGLKEGISIDADSGSPRYVLWCCGGICHEVLTFIQIGCGHTVRLGFFLQDYLHELCTQGSNKILLNTYKSKDILISMSIIRVTNSKSDAMNEICNIARDIFILGLALYLVQKKSDVPSWPTYQPTMSHFSPTMLYLPTYPK